MQEVGIIKGLQVLQQTDVFLLAAFTNMPGEHEEQFCSQCSVVPVIKECQSW